MVPYLLVLFFQCHQRVSVRGGCSFIGLVLCSSAVPEALHHALFLIQHSYVRRVLPYCIHVLFTLFAYTVQTLLCTLLAYYPSSSSVATFQAVAYEYAVEMTYPLPEGTSATIINVVSQVSWTLLSCYSEWTKLVC